MWTETSTKHKAQHSVIKELGLDSGNTNSMQKEVVRQNLDQRECTLQLRKKYMTRNMREVCQLDSNPLMEALLSSLNVQTS